MPQKNHDSATAVSLNSIKGIGPDKAGQLRTAGIETVTQLAAKTPEEVAALVSGASVKTARRWIDQAQELAPAPAKPNPPDDRQHYATFKVELLLDETQEVRRTRVEHVQSSAEDHWACWDNARLATFMQEKAGLAPPQPPPASLATAVSPSPEPEPKSEKKSPPAPPPQPPAQPQVEALYLTTPDDDHPCSVLTAGHPLNAHLEMKLTDLTPSSETAVAYGITIYAKKLGAKKRLAIGKKEGRQAATEPLVLDIPGETPAPGAYRLEAGINLETAVSSPDDPPLLNTIIQVPKAFLQVNA